MHELLTPVEVSAAEGCASPELSGQEKKGGIFNLGGLFSDIGGEEILLIGLIILLLAENADIELVIILAFLLIAGL